MVSGTALSGADGDLTVTGGAVRATGAAAALTLEEALYFGINMTAKSSAKPAMASFFECGNRRACRAAPLMGEPMLDCKNLRRWTGSLIRCARYSTKMPTRLRGLKRTPMYPISDR